MIPVIEGTWQPIRAELAGLAAPSEVLEQTELELAGGRYRVRFGGQTSDRGTYVHHPAESPGVLTLFGVEGPNADRTIPCIYQLAGDRLRICYGLGGVLPTAFRTGGRASLYLVTYRRKRE